MLNILDAKTKAAARAFYRTRLVTAGAWLVIAATLAGLVGLLPAYLLGNANLALFAASKESAAISGAAAAVASTSAELAVLGNPPRKAEPILAEVIAAQTAGVTIDSLRFSQNPALFQVSGIGADRAALVAYQLALQAEPGFAAVNLPVSNLTKDSAIPFTITITLR